MDTLVGSQPRHEVLLQLEIQSVHFSYFFYCKLSVECYMNVHLSYFFSYFIS